jgi:hypothetical protein
MKESVSGFPSGSFRLLQAPSVPVFVSHLPCDFLLLFRYFYYTTKSIRKEAEMPVFSRLHGVLNALGCSISRPLHKPIELLPCKLTHFLT